MDANGNAVTWLLHPNTTLLIMALFQLLTAIVGLVGIVISVRNHNLTTEIKVATDGMQAALLQKTGEAAFAKGSETARVAGEEKAAALVNDRRQ